MLFILYLTFSYALNIFFIFYALFFIVIKDVLCACVRVCVIFKIK